MKNANLVNFLDFGMFHPTLFYPETGPLVYFALLDPRPQLEGPYKIRSVRLSVSFLIIGLLVFSEN